MARGGPRQACSHLELALHWDVGVPGQQTIKKSHMNKIITLNANKGSEENKQEYKKTIRTEARHTARGLDTSLLSGLWSALWGVEQHPPTFAPQ